MQLDFSDPTLFGNDAGEEEDPELLASYFVDQPSFSTFLNPVVRLQFARSRKGMGKSALLAKLAYDLRKWEPESIVIQVSGADLTGLGEFISPDPAVQVNQWQQVICARISQEIGKEIGFAWSDAEMMMVESAEISGLRDRSIIRALVDRLGSKLAKLEITRPEIKNAHELLRRVQDNSENRRVWLLVDDIDATFVDNPSMRLKTGTFFSACRKLSREVHNLFLRASVRTDVWSILRSNEDLDKAEQYMSDIRWTRREMELILAKRIFAYLHREYPTLAQRLKLDDESDSPRILELAFEERMHWAGYRVPPIRVLNILCGKRPRWMAQLCRLAGVEATRGKARRIREHHLQRVMQRFGELRLGDLHKEHGHQFSDLPLLIETFAGRERRYSTEAVLDLIQSEYMRRTAAKGIPRLEGKIVRSPMELAHFLFRTGFLQGSPSDDDTDDYVDYDNRPDLLTNDINPDDGLEWLVYPPYRKVLRIE